MRYHEVCITVYLHADIHFTQAGEIVSNTINRAMLLDPELAQKHAANGYKFYTFSYPYPAEQDKVYKTGRIYLIRIRSLEKGFVDKLKELLPAVAKEFKVLASEVKEQKYRFISELTTITPAICTVEGRHWTPQDDILLLQERMHINLLKKYKHFYGTSLETNQNFIQYMEILNNKPLALKYKNTTLITNKFKLQINPEDASQKLAFCAMATGLLEKGSLGLGFCAAK